MRARRLIDPGWSIVWVWTGSELRGERLLGFNQPSPYVTNNSRSCISIGDIVKDEGLGMKWLRRLLNRPLTNETETCQDCGKVCRGSDVAEVSGFGLTCPSCYIHYSNE
jgi:hypothetical protein